MLRIRLRRVGKKKQPMYRIVVADSRAPRDGAFVESLGYYHPLNNPSTIVLDEERAKHWLDHGAQPSDRVAKLLKIQGLAEIPAKLATRMALGEQRAQEAQVEKAKAAKAAETEAKASAPAPAAEAPAAAPPEPAPEASAEAPAAEAPAEAPAAEAPVDAPVAEKEQAAE
jgi:small subunit ribosomal protein S16